MAAASPPPAAHEVGEGPPLVLLHGLTGTWRMWTPVLPALAAHHRVVALTLPGHHGAAALPADVQLSLPTLADALEAQLDAAGLAQVHIAGNSLGGWLSLELARRGRALSVVALSPAGGWRTLQDLKRVVTQIDGAARMGARVRGLMAPVLRPGAVRRVAFRGTMEHVERIPPRAVGEILDDLVGCSVLAEFMASTERDEPFLGGMEHVTAPIRIAWAEKDRTIPFDRYGAPLVERIPGAELVMLPGVGHVPMWDDPELVARTILEVTAPAAVAPAGRRADRATA